MASLRLFLCVSALLPIIITKAKASQIGEETEEHRAYANTTLQPDCPIAFDLVGGRCVMVNPLEEGTWDEAMFFCESIGSTLAETDTIDFFYELLDFLRWNELDHRSYWLGAKRTRGIWYFEISDEDPSMGSPFWAIKYVSGSTYEMEPGEGDNQDCMRMDKERFLYLDGDVCTNYNSVICEKPRLR